MGTGVSDSPDRANWKSLYNAALLDIAHEQIQDRIALAEQAIVERERELGRSVQDNIDEQEVLEDALYTLNALRQVCDVNFRKPVQNSPAMMQRTGT